MPPNLTPPIGEVFRTFSIMPKSALADGGDITNRAHIRFDYNPFLAAPEIGVVQHTIGELCACTCPADPSCDGVRSDVLDVVLAVNVAFRNALETTDPFCPISRTDVNCSGATDVLDVVSIIDVAFRNADQTVKYCAPCEF